MRIDRNNTLAILIDVQYRLFPHIDQNELLEYNTIKLLQGLKVLSVPVMVTEQYVKGLGQTILPLQETLMNDYHPSEKMEFSCYDNSDIKKQIDDTKKSNIVLFGIESHVCVLQTAIDLKNAGFSVWVVRDCTSSRSHKDKETAFQRMISEGIYITSVESILLELCRTSASAEFKEISKIIK